MSNVGSLIGMGLNAVLSAAILTTMGVTYFKVIKPAISDSKKITKQTASKSLEEKIIFETMKGQIIDVINRIRRENLYVEEMDDESKILELAEKIGYRDAVKLIFDNGLYVDMNILKTEAINYISEAIDKIRNELEEEKKDNIDAILEKVDPYYFSEKDVKYILISKYGLSEEKKPEDN